MKLFGGLLCLLGGIFGGIHLVTQDIGFSLSTTFSIGAIFLGLSLIITEVMDY